ncbi:MAG: hypothetical protein IKR23_07095 [Lachnospiraceae bacterium]|nr:hypothetical protein [Lachnospiraceae bacterium]
MFYPAIVVVVLMGILGIISAKEKVPGECEASAVTRPFYRMAVWLERVLRDSSMRKRVFLQNEERFRVLEPAADARRSARILFIKKCGLCFLLVTVGMIFTLLITYSEAQEPVLGEDGSLMRREYGKGRYSVELDAEIDGEVSTVDVAVDERVYTEAEIEEMLPDFRKRLESAVLGKNESPDHVCRDLNPVSEIKGYPFYVEWDFGNREVFNRMGEIKEDIPADGSICEITAHISYEDHEELYSFSVMAYPEELSSADRLKRSIEDALSTASDKSRSEVTYKLPSEIDGVAVKWQERKKNSAVILSVMIIVAAAAVYWGRDKDLDKKIKERDEQLKQDYPEMVSKLSLYIGAGMSTRMAWRKMTDEYRQKGITRYVYEEMLLACREMESGVSELQAYQHFAKRCRLQKYVKLVSLLEQNTRLGAAGFLSTMRSECKDALQERKAEARRMGEEAGTRLLLPMIMMLAIVMVVIIVPAFVSI